MSKAVNMNKFRGQILGSLNTHLYLIDFKHFCIHKSSNNIIKSAKLN